MARRKLCRSSELLATWTCYSIPVIPLLPPTHPELSFQVIYLSLYVWFFHSSNSCSVLQLRNNAESRFTGDRIIHHELKEVWLYLFFFLSENMTVPIKVPISISMIKHSRKTYSRTRCYHQAVYMLLHTPATCKGKPKSLGRGVYATVGEDDEAGGEEAARRPGATVITSRGA